MEWVSHREGVRRTLRKVAAKARRLRPVVLSSRPVIERLESRSLLSAAPAEQAVPQATAAAASSTPTSPQIRSVSPGPNSRNVPLDAFISAELIIPNGGINSATLTSKNVYLYRMSNKVAVPATVNTSGGGDVIVLKPNERLAANSLYRFVVTSGVRDVAGKAFVSYYCDFTTGSSVSASSNSPVKFTQVAQSTSAGKRYFGMAIGPDRRLYAGGEDGRIYRFSIKSDGSLSAPSVFDTVRSRNGGARFIVGFAFDPRSTASNVILWITHTATSSLVLGGAAGANWTGKVSVVSGSNLSQYRDAVVGLPRSVRDHMTMQPTFGPDGALYFCQGSQSAMGRADVVWGSRSEQPLSSAILRLDVAAVASTTLNVRPASAGGSYDPNKPGAPLTIYADGVRNAFDLTWHSNGQLYAATNGSAAGGNTPAGNGAPALNSVSKAETDFLFRVAKGRYYGHPNVYQKHYVLNGGNPTAGKDPYEVTDYPVGTMPDLKWQPAIYDLGAHRSPAGSLEYTSSRFGGALKGKLLITRYSGGDDILVLTLNASGGVARAETGITGLTGLADPVDLVQDPATGNLYVIEFAKNRITLLRAAVGGSTPQGGDTDIPVDDPGEPPTVGGGNGEGPIVANPPPAPPAITKADQRRIDKIEKLCAKLGTGVPDVESLRGKELATALKTVRRLKSIASSQNRLLPDLKGKTLQELRAMFESSGSLGGLKKIR